MQVEISRIIEVPDLERQIKEARIKDRRTLTELARLAGISRAQWHNIESGKVKVLPWNTLQRIQAALAVKFEIIEIADRVTSS